MQLDAPENISKEVKSLLVAEIQSHNQQFPANRFFTQLTAEQSQLEQTEKLEKDGNFQPHLIHMPFKPAHLIHMPFKPASWDGYRRNG